MIYFNTNLVYLFINLYSTGDLTGFKDNFIKGIYIKVEEISPNTTTIKVIIKGKGISSYMFKDDTGELFVIQTRILYLD